MGNNFAVIIPISKVWKPDIVCEEDIANEPYSPRIPYVTVTHEGEISHHEPVQYETTCSVNIAYFPFDKQVYKLYPSQNNKNSTLLMLWSFGKLKILQTFGFNSYLTNDYNLNTLSLGVKHVYCFAVVCILQSRWKVAITVNVNYSQVCTISMVSWSLSSAKLDLVSRRNAEEMMTYTKDYFLASGEWILDQIIVKKRVSYKSLITLLPLNCMLPH